MKMLSSRATREWILRQPGGQELILRIEPGQALTVGRDLTSDLPILDAGVSRHHATISLEREEGGTESLWLEDLHSHNGTFVNTERVQRTRIHSGDIITFGRIPLSLTERQHVEETVDPLQRLTPDKLALLLRVAREFSAEPEKSMIFQKLLDLAAEVLEAERGAVLLWEEERRLFHPVAASPHALFQDVGHLMTALVGESILREGKARLLWLETIRGGSRLECVPSSFAPAPTALATPILAGLKPLGILYIDRVSSARGFQATDADFLFALAWVTNTALGTSCQLSDMRDWNERLESMVSQQRAEGDSTVAVGTPMAKVATLLRDLEGLLGSTLEARSAGLDTHCLERALRAAHLRTRVLRCLCDRESARLEEVQVAHALREAAERIEGLTGCRIEGGGDLSVLCAPDELELALLLAMDFLACAEQARGKEETYLRGGAAASPDGATVHLRIECPRAQEKATRSKLPGALDDPAAPPPTKPLGPAKEAQALALRLMKGLVKERLRGSLDVDPDAAWLELKLPQATISLGETVALPPGRLGAEALRSRGAVEARGPQ